jgi:hypothetical protein
MLALRLGNETAHHTKLVWPNFLVEESDLPEAALKFEVEIDELSRRMPVCGIRRESDNRLVANASGVLIYADPRVQALPDSAWRYAMENFCSRVTPNSLCLLAANADPAFSWKRRRCSPLG